jgi:hypothetical protein
LIFDLCNERKPGIAPSRKEGTLTPRCPHVKVYRAVAKRKGAYDAMTLWFIKDFSTDFPKGSHYKKTRGCGICTRFSDRIEGW